MIRKMKKIVLILVSGLIAASAHSDDGPPSLMTYQGHLVDAQGEPVGADSPEAKNIQFRIFTAEQGGDVVYAEEQTVTVDKGYFSVLLGQGTSLPGEPGPPSTLFSKVFEGNKSDERYIGIRVEGTDINPRLRYVASPYAVLSQRSVLAGHAQTVESISGHKADTAGRSDSALRADAAAKVDTISGHKADSAKLADKATQVISGFVPINGIIMWTQRTVPAGWRLCDGGGSTPNLVNRFVVGAGSWYGLGATGGANTVAMSWNEMPVHNHSGGVHGGGNHYHGIYTRQDDWNDSGGWGPSWGNGDNGRWAPHHSTHWGGHHGHGMYTNNAGRGWAHENRPPFYAVYYIMRVK
jgi:hypothetical protein